MHICAQKEG